MLVLQETSSSEINPLTASGICFHAVKYRLIVKGSLIVGL